MNSESSPVLRPHLRVRPTFLAGCATVVVVLILPDALIGRPLLQKASLVIASLAIIFGWYFLVALHDAHPSWRKWIATVTTIYLTLSVPVFFFEMSQMRWFMHHPLLSKYAGPWVHWGFIMVCLGVVGSFFGSGRARIALVAGSVLLLVLRLSMGVWVY